MLNKFSKNKGVLKKKKCLGRGASSGKGKTCGRGGKGQTARSGVSVGLFEGGQTPLYRRLPKRGFVSRFKKVYNLVNIHQINSFVKNGKLNPENITISDLVVLLGCNKNSKIKLLGDGDISQKMNIEVHSVSKKLLDRADKAGLSIKIIKNE